MDAITITIFTVIFLLFLYWWQSLKKHLPPGPRGVPLLGNLLDIYKSGDFIGYVEKQRKQYGDVFTMWFATTPTVVVSGYKNVYDMFVTKADVTCGRPQTITLKEFSNGHGILFQDGEPWKQMRRFTLKALRDLGFNKKGTEEKIVEEVAFIVAEVDKFSGKTWDGSKSLFNMVTCTIISSLIFGERFEYTDPTFTELLQKLRDGVRASSSPSIFDLMPVYMSFLKPKFIETPSIHFATAVKGFAREQIAKHRKAYDPNDIRDFVDYCIKVTSEGTENLTRVLHRATEDFKFCGYDIPKNANLIPNLFQVMHDPEYWTNPDVFDPCRFLSADGEIVKHASLIPFSIGPRVCLGETLARTEVFVFFANLLQHFRFSRVPNDHEDYLSQYTCPSIIRGAVNYQTRVTRRE